MFHFSFWLRSLYVAGFFLYPWKPVDLCGHIVYLAILYGSWMSIESLAGGIFIVVVLVDRFFPYFVFKTMAISSALILMLSQGLIVYRTAAIPAWNVWLTPVIFVTSGFMTACGLVLLNTQIHSGTDSLMIVIFLICIFLNLVAWLLYLYRYHDNDIQKTAKYYASPCFIDGYNWNRPSASICSNLLPCCFRGC